MSDAPQSDIAAKKAASAEIIEAVLMKGDLSKLDPAERVSYYRAVCESVGLNPLTKPFEYLNLSGKLTLYARKDATEQLRRIHGISVEKLEHSLDTETGIFMVVVYGRDLDNRTDTATGAVPIAGLKGEALSNAYMKAETKAKRRLTLSMAGLGWLDESEIESIPRARTGGVDLDSGELREPAYEAKPLAPLKPMPKKKVQNPEADAYADEVMDAEFDRLATQPSEGPGKVPEAASFAASNSDVRGGQTQPPSEGPAWLTQIVGIGPWSSKTWGYLCAGSCDGDRSKWISAELDRANETKGYSALLKGRLEHAIVQVSKNPKKGG